MHPLFFKHSSLLNPSVAIVILNWNGRKFLEQFLPSVMATTYPKARIVLADNASTDDSVAFVKEKYSAIEVIRLKENFGFAKGYNEALKQFNDDYFVLLNSDVEVQPGWVEPVIALMESDSQSGACQPKILQYDNKKLFEYAGASGGWLDSLGYPFARGRIFDVCEEDRGQYDTNEKIFWASGAAMFVRSKVYRKLGGLDEFFFAHQEEIDLCWRMQLMGYNVYCCPASVVYHVGGGTLPKGNSRKVFLNFRNNLVMLTKNMHGWEAFWKVGFRLILDDVSAMKSLLAGEGTYFMAVLRAHRAYFRWLFTAKKPVRERKKGYRLNGYFRGSVVWRYFILKKKSFEEILGRKTGNIG